MLHITEVLEKQQKGRKRVADKKVREIVTTLGSTSCIQFSATNVKPKKKHVLEFRKEVNKKITFYSSASLLSHLLHFSKEKGRIVHSLPPRFKVKLIFRLTRTNSLFFLSRILENRLNSLFVNVLIILLLL